MIQSQFGLYDKNGDGKLDPTEAAEAWEEWIDEVTSSDGIAALAAKRMDVDGDGTISGMDAQDVLYKIGAPNWLKGKVASIPSTSFTLEQVAEILSEAFDEMAE